ncbi:hypothetical protein RHGRI_037924 [Rhododendron griersonianum]|uniref:Uncharacterized protein n=1 Tax=Rhododendron griersonianum TaxID=479676 RepID=A0AAV6HX53_9ERIC|nr:hypothetical protein RHGRI_037924 [Rhododendron griersonianum]
MHYANSIHPLLLLLVSQHPNIESIEIMDSKKHGKVRLQGGQLTKLKNNMSKSMMPPPNIASVGGFNEEGDIRIRFDLQQEAQEPEV